MVIELDDKAVQEMSPQALLLEFSIWLYQTGKLTKANARRLAQQERIDFDLVLAERGIGSELTEDNYQQDLDALKRFRP